MRHIYADFIDSVTKPARYLGGEYQSVQKDHATVEATICLAFPDVYDIGMSHLGTKILYSLLNRDVRIACERVFAPWVDMEAELRARALPLVALESQRPLNEFDVIGISLQYELTFTNMLTLLELGRCGVWTHERAADAPLILVGGPVASHPEPVAPFIDAAFVGEAEETLPALICEWAGLRRQIAAGRLSRLEALAQLAARYALYVPALYAVEIDADTGMQVVGAPLAAGVPATIKRAMVRDLNKFPFPSDSPVPYAEAVFERASVEIARGCTEGCRFCQAGMIYRPVRERSPESIIESVLGGVDKAGYEETGLTCLSTADFSSIGPLVSKVAGELRKRGVSMSVASLRAYGLSEELLDELATTRIAGLTFAPEAGTQRMRDVVNKNITEAHIELSARRVFERGWHRLKLYFMMGLPTETDEDVVGIVDTGKRMLGIGRQYLGKRAEVTVSVSSHVPKPHTPFQWCAQDSHAEIVRKQAGLRSHARVPGLRLKHHDAGISWVEGILSRGDRRVAQVIFHAWQAGARFDGWDELFDLERWEAAMAATGLDASAYLATRPIHARLPWDHIDVGLEDGFLLSEYRKALKARLSPPCGKVAGQLVHHTNLEDASADARKLVCYDCGVACDLSQMRTDRLVALTTLGATHRARPKAQPLAAVDAAGMVDVSERGGGSPAERDDGAAEPVGELARDAAALKQKRQQIFVEEAARAERVRLSGHKGAGPKYATYRLRVSKLGRAAFLGHLDFMRLMSRSFRRADLPVAMTRGFSPKPRFAFGPALGLGVPSLLELMDVDLEHAPTLHGEFLPRHEAPDGCAWAELPASEVASRLAEVLPPGIVLHGCDIVRLNGHEFATANADEGLGRLITGVDVVIAPTLDGMRWDAARMARYVEKLRAMPEMLVQRRDRALNIRPYVLAVEAIVDDAALALCEVLDWPRSEALLKVRLSSSAEGSAKPQEVAAIAGLAPEGRALVARLGVVTARHAQQAPWWQPAVQA